MAITEILTFLKSQLNEKIKLYAIVDAGIYKNFLDLMDIEGEEKIRILLKEPYLHGLEAAAPYLMALDGDDALADGLIHASLGEYWLTFVTSHKDLDTLALELREMIVPFSEQHGHEIIYRFYDPRNIENYLLMHNEEELAGFYNDIGGALFVIDAQDPSVIHVYSQEGIEMIDLKEEG